VDQFGIGQDTFLKHVLCVFAKVVSISIHGQSRRVSTIGIVTRLRVVRSRVRFQAWTKHFSLILNVHTGPGAHPTSYTMRIVIGDVKLTHHLHLLSTLRTSGGIPLRPLNMHKFFQISRSHLKTLGARRATWSNFHTKKPKILGATEQNLVV
jgi:hypothetical protein